MWETIATPGKALYVFWLLLPVAFAPLFSGFGLILLAPGLLQNLLTNFSHQYEGFYQYDALLIPAIWLCAVYAFTAMQKKWPGSTRSAIIGISIFMAIGFIFRSPVSPLQFPTELFRRTVQEESYRALVALVPERATVAAHTNILPHVAHRPRVYMLGAEPSLADIVIADAADPFGFESTEVFERYLEQYTTSADYETQVFDERYLFIRRRSLAP